MDLWEGIKKHPYVAAGVVLGVIVLLWLLLRGGSSAASSGGTSDLAAFYSAQAAMANSGNQLAAAQAGYNAQLGIATTQAGAATTIAQLQEATKQQANRFNFSSNQAKMQYDYDIAAGGQSLIAQQNRFAFSSDQAAQAYKSMVDLGNIATAQQANRFAFASDQASQAYKSMVDLGNIDTTQQKNRFDFSLGQSSQAYGYQANLDALNEKYAAASNANDTAVSLANIAAAVTNNQTAAGLQLGLAQNDTSRVLGEATLTTQQIESNNALTAAETAAQQAIDIANGANATAITLAQGQNSTALSEAQIAADSQDQQLLAQLQAGLQSQKISAYSTDYQAQLAAMSHAYDTYSGGVTTLSSEALAAALASGGQVAITGPSGTIGANVNTGGLDPLASFFNNIAFIKGLGLSHNQPSGGGNANPPPGIQ